MKTADRLRWQRRIINLLSRLRSCVSRLRRQRDARHPAIELLGTVQTWGNTVYRRPIQGAFPPGSVESPGGWPDVQLYRVHAARVSGLCGSVFLPDDRLFSVCPWSELLDDRHVRRPLGIFVQHVKRPLLLLLGRNQENHGHFLFEYLPRVIAAERLLGKSSNWRIGIAAEHARWQQRYLSLLGYGEDRVVALHSGTTRVDELLFVPLLSGTSSLPDPAHLQATVERLQAGGQRSIGNPTSRRPGHVVFVSRTDSPNKRLLNETQLVAAAREFFPSVEVLVLTGKPLAEQLRIMLSAEIIIGAQGMGLANMAFLRDRVLVCLEAGMPQPEAAWDVAYCIVAELGGNRSLTLYGGEDRIMPHRDFVYPVDRFKDEMRRLASLLR